MSELGDHRHHQSCGGGKPRGRRSFSESLDGLAGLGVGSTAGLLDA